MLICLNEAKRTQMIDVLKAYCQLDTLATVGIYRFLLKISED
jgi:hypothetical protein